jgi:hypothetical protein
MQVLSQYHIFESYKINIYSVLNRYPSRETIFFFHLTETYDQMQIVVLSCPLTKSPFIKNVNSTIVFSGMLSHQTAAVALHWKSL